jgi:hypothetical protein
LVAGKRNWDGKQSEQQAVEANQSRVAGDYGKRLLRRRGELVERSFAHCYETGGIRHCTLREQENILKRLLIHVGAFNISLILRKTLGAGTPRELRNRATRLLLRLFKWLTCHYRPNDAVESRTAPVLALSGAYQPVAQWPIFSTVSRRTLRRRIHPSEGKLHVWGPGVAFLLCIDRCLPIRLMPTTTRCSVLPFSGVELGIGWSGGAAGDAQEGPKSVETIESSVEPKGEFVQACWLE